MIKEIAVFGERNSGTNYLANLIRKNFSGVDVVNYYGWKHGDIGQKIKFYDDKGQLKSYKKLGSKKPGPETLIIVIFRNPITWLQSMHNSPHHAPMHWHIPISPFLRKKWRCYYSVKGQPSSLDEEKRFTCVHPDNLFEEFDSILGLRNFKVQLHRNFSEKAKNVAFVNYEELAEQPMVVLSRIAQVYEFNMSKKFANITKDKHGKHDYKKKTYASLSLADLDYIVDNLDWAKEADAGYMLDEQRLKWMRLRSRWLQPFRKNKQVLGNPASIIVNDHVREYFKDGKPAVAP